MTDTADAVRSFAVRNRVFCEGDNLEFLLRMPDASVDLIATDPPFNKNREFQGIGKAEEQSFKDYWTWEDDVHLGYLEHVRKHWPGLHEVVEAAYAAHSPGMAAFLSFMSVRLIEMRRVLKPTGSIYLHCDSTASHYLKLVMDSLFGQANFRNEIVWAYTGPGNTRRWFPRKHDTILFYARSNAAGFNQDAVRVPYVRISGTGASSLAAGGRTREEMSRIETEYAKRGKVIEDWWTDIPAAGHMPRAERTGYPTQKPLALYRRIIEASSNPGDMVLDPFCGCATTCVAAEQLGRQWIGIDLSPKARNITLDRLAKEAGDGKLWANKVQMLTIHDLRELPDGVEGALSVPQLPERQRRGARKGYRAEDVRRYLAAREAAGTRMRDAGNEACQGCGYRPPRLEYLDVDHIVPQAKEGPSAWDNLCLLCAPCNRRKAHKLTIDELRAQVRAEGLLLDEPALMPMDAAAIAKRDKALRPLE